MPPLHPTLAICPQFLFHGSASRIIRKDPHGIFLLLCRTDPKQSRHILPTPLPGTLPSAAALLQGLQASHPHSLSSFGLLARSLHEVFLSFKLIISKSSKPTLSIDLGEKAKRLPGISSFLPSNNCISTVVQTRLSYISPLVTPRLLTVDTKRKNIIIFVIKIACRFTCRKTYSSLLTVYITL